MQDILPLFDTDATCLDTDGWGPTKSLCFFEWCSFHFFFFLCFRLCFSACLNNKERQVFSIGTVAAYSAKYSTLVAYKILELSAHIIYISHLSCHQMFIYTCTLTLQHNLSYQITSKDKTTVLKSSSFGAHLGDQHQLYCCKCHCPCLILFHYHQ